MFLLPIITFSQNDLSECKFIFDTQNQCDGEFTARIDAERLDDFEPVVANIFFWEIKDSNGNIDEDDYNPGWDFEKEALDVVAELNIYYNPFKIFFKYKGTGTIENTALYDKNKITDFLTYLNNLIAASETPEDLKNFNAINTYVAPKISGGAGTPFAPRYTLSRETFDTRLDVSTHEVGHVFGLLHTHQYWFNCSDSGLPDEFLAENVTRNSSDPNYNADTNGDRVPDTAASPNLKFQKCYEAGYTGPLYEGCPESYLWSYVSNCQYTNTSVLDCSNPGVNYNISADDVKNIMSYAPNDCKGIFTMGQGIRMREAIETSCAYDIGLRDAINNDGVASLFEPYKGEYYFAGPLPLDDDGNLIPPLFQPGFDYNFVSCDCDCPLPLDYGDTNFIYYDQLGTFIHKEETNYSIITHPNHTAIRILQLDETQPWRCYDNNNRRPNGGTIIKFNDNVLNTNVTITPQDSTSINNENLINNLQPGLYNIIEQFEDGDIQEKVILKENN